jgi:hypothetical protein
MRWVIEGLIVLVGIAVLALLFLVRGERPCEAHPFFMLQGTTLDCAVRNPIPTGPMPADAVVVAKME